MGVVVPFSRIGYGISHWVGHKSAEASRAQASAVMGVTGVTIHVLLLALGVTYRTGTLSAGQITLVGTALACVGAAGAVAALFPRLRFRAGSRFDAQVHSVRSSVIDLAEHPGRLTRLVVGSFLVTVSYVSAMPACLAAVGVSIDPAAAAVAYLVAAGLAVPSPSPGGVGIVEALLTSAYIIIGVAPAPALAAVLLFRMVTFWLPLVPGWVSYRMLKRRSTWLGEPSQARAAA